MGNGGSREPGGSAVAPSEPKILPTQAAGDMQDVPPTPLPADGPDMPQQPPAFPDVTPGLENNPGPYEDMHKKVKDVFPICFDGAKLMVQKALSNNFQVSHMLNMSAMNSGYRFGATYVGSNQISAQEVYPVLLGDTDFSGNVSASVIHGFGTRWKCKAVAQLQKGTIAGTQLTTEYRHPVYTGSLTIVNPDLANESGILVGSILRRVHRRLDIGAELMYQYGRMVPHQQFSVLTYAARYNGDNFTASAAMGKSGLHCSYYHKQQPNLQFGVEWETSLLRGDSVASLGYQIELPKANVVFRGSVDSNWTVGAVLEKRLVPFPFTFAMSGMVNHAKQQSRFGLGLIIG